MMNQCFDILDLSIFDGHNHCVMFHLLLVFYYKRGVGDCYNPSSKLHMYKILSSGCHYTKIHNGKRGLFMYFKSFASCQIQCTPDENSLKNNTDYNM
jgi:hypothetical protein